MHPFEQIDHPITLFAEAALATGLLRNFFHIRRRKGIMPVVTAIVAFLVWFDLAARIMQLESFWISNAGMFTGFALLVWLANAARQTEAAATPAVPADRFDRWQPLVLRAGLVGTAALLMYAAVRTHQTAQRVEREREQAAIRENTRVTKEHTSQQANYDVERDSILKAAKDNSQKLDGVSAALASLSATQQTLLAGQVRSTGRLPRPRSQPVATIQTPRSVTAVGTYPTPPVNRTLAAPAAPPPEKRGFFRKLFGSTGPTDTLMPTDTLVFQQ